MLRYHEEVFLVFLFATLLLLFVTGGCTSAKQITQHNSYIAPDYMQAQSIASMLAERLEHEYPLPDRATLYISPNDPGGLLGALEQRCREAGFAIAREEGPDTVTVIVLVDQLKNTVPAKAYAFIKTNQGLQFTRIFDAGSLEMAKVYTEGRSDEKR